MKKYRKAEYVQHRVRFVNVQSSLHENVVFSIWEVISGNFLKGGEGGMFLRDGTIFEVVFNF